MAMRQFPAKLPPELNGTPFYGFDFASGVDRPVEAFKNYARINKAKLFYNGKALYYVVFADTYRWQHVNFRGHHGKSRGPNQRHQQQYGKKAEPRSSVTRPKRPWLSGEQDQAGWAV
jgi:hypothetical protein